MANMKELFKEIRYLTVRLPNWLGDNIMALPTLIKLKETNPHLKLTFFCPENIVSLWKLIGLADEIYSYRNFIDCIIKSIYLPLKGESFIVFPNSFSSAFSAYLTGSKNIIGYKGNFRNIFLTHHRIKNEIGRMHQVDEYYKLIFGEKSNTKLCPIIKINKSKEQIYEYFQLNIEKEKRIAAISPGAAWGRSKRWFEEYYKILIKELLKSGYLIFLIGTKEEIKPYEKLKEKGNVQEISGSIEEIAYSLSISDIAVGNDSGLMHLSAAVGCQTIIIYGATDWRRTYPRCSNAYVISAEIPCQPCWKRKCRRKDYLCLKLVSPNDILQLIKKVGYV